KLFVTGVSCTWLVPFLVLSYTCHVPGAAFPPVPGLARRWSADRRLSPAARAWEGRRRLGLARGRLGRQAPPLVFSAWDSATRNAAVAVVNSGGSAPPAPPAPCPVISHVIVAVARKAPPGCPALELV